MKKKENILDVAVHSYITGHDMAEKMDDLRTFLKVYLNELQTRHNIPTRQNFNWHAKVLQLEEKKETWKDAQEIWNASWILDEVRNIESSLKQIEICIKEKEKLEQTRMV